MAVKLAPLKYYTHTHTELSMDTYVGEAQLAEQSVCISVHMYVTRC